MELYGCYDRRYDLGLAFACAIVATKFQMNDFQCQPARKRCSDLSQTPSIF